MDPLEHWARAFEPPITDPYATDPQGWAHDKLDAFLWSKQREIFASVVEHRRTAVKSCHGPGKSWSAGALAAWWIDTHPPGEAFVVSTAPSYPQVHAILWEEIRKQHHKGTLAGRVLQTDEWKIADTLVGMGRKPSDYDEHAFQGIHRRYVLVILDEACGIPEQLWTAAESITTNEDCRILAIGNPDDPNTAFGKACKPGSGWNVLQISAFDTPNLTGEAVPDYLRPLLPSRDWVEDKALRWGVDSPVYQSKVLGEFPEISENTLIPARHVTAAQQRDLDGIGWPAVFGVDVARFGTDRSVVACLRGSRVRVLGSWGKTATTETTGKVIHLAREHGAEEIRVDGVGVGGGVVDQLAEQGYPVIDMQAGGGADNSVMFLNARAEWYWGLRQRFEQGDIDIDALDDELAAQLTAIRYRFTGRGQVVIESKDDMRKRGMPSPDRADAVMLACANAAPAAVDEILTAADLLDEDRDPMAYLKSGW